MKAIVKYLSYLVRHKWFVMIECFKVGLIWRGLVHDMSKFLPDEFFPYANYFYGPDGWKHRRSKHGYYRPYHTGDEHFDFAWLKHQKRNRHHWQWWVLPKDDGRTIVFPMAEKYMKEMICDWKGAGRAQGKSDDDLVPWWEENKGRMRLSPRTRHWIEMEIFGIPF